MDGFPFIHENLLMDELYRFYQNGSDLIKFFE